MPGYALADTVSGKTGSVGSTSPGVVTTSADHTKSMDSLMQAAERLREAVQAMAQAPADEQRNSAIQAAREALFDTQQAMIQLPPELRTHTGTTMSDAEYAKAMDRLKEATQRLRESVQAMAKQPAGERRNQAIKEANEAILEANQAMVLLPSQPRTTTAATAGMPGGTSSPPGGTAGAAIGGKSASAFDRMDRNRDDVISREEFAPHGRQMAT